MDIFDRQQLTRQRDRTISQFHEHDFLFLAVADQVMDRLADIKRNFENSLVIGTRGAGVLLPRLYQIGKVSGTPIILDPSDAETLPAPTDALYDLVLSLLELHTINDLPGLFAQIKNQMTPDGVFCATLFGGETLYELRDCLQQAELVLRGGASPHVFPFASKQQIGDLLQRTGYALPVVDSEIIRVHYTNLDRLLHDLRGMGQGNAIAARTRRFAPRHLFKQTEQFYREKYGTPDEHLIATFEIIHLIGWAPHASQPQPKPRGSGHTPLAEALQSKK